MQLYAVRNPKTGELFIFDNHDAALRCRIDQKLNQDFLIGCVIYSDWKNKQPLRLKDVSDA